MTTKASQDSDYKAPLPTYVLNIDAATYRTERALVGMQAAVDKLAEALAGQQGLDADALKQAVKDGIAESVVDVDITVSSQSATA